MRAFLATLVLACSLNAAAAQSCAPAAAVLAVVQAHPDYASHHVATAAEAGLASGIFNAVPPESDIDWSLALLVAFRDGSGALLVGGGGLICGSLRVGAQHWPAFVRSVRGSGV